ncbi:hypothetical protein ACQP3D_29765, partial [Escherichia coli]
METFRRAKTLSLSLLHSLLECPGWASWIWIWILLKRPFGLHKRQPGPHDEKYSKSSQRAQ